MKKLAVIGCGVAANPILKKAKEMNIETHCFAKEEMPTSKGLSDYFYNIDFSNVDEVYKKCVQIGVDGVIATSEITTSYTTILADMLNLPGNNVEKAFAIRNKYLMRKSLDTSKYVKQPKYKYYDGIVPKELPIIVKATDSCGKKGISLAKDVKEFEVAVKYAQQASSDGKVLIEEYLEGEIEYSVECLSSHGKHYIIQITKKDSSGAPHFSELGHHQPAMDLQVPFSKIQEAINEILNGVGIVNSMSHVEIKIINNEVYFIEAGARAGGDRIADTLTYLSTDYDYFRGAIDIAVDQFIESEVNNIAYSGIYFLCKQTSFLKPLFEFARNKEWCIECKIPNSSLVQKDLNDDGGASGFLIYKADHKISLRDVDFEAERINEKNNALELLIDFNKRISRSIEYDELVKGMQKFIDKGNVVAIIYDNKIIAMLNMYCNDFEEKKAYINNVEVLEEYRGNGLATIILEKAIQIASEKRFEKIQLHVAPDNKVAINLYEKYGFVLTGEESMLEAEVTVEMVKEIKEIIK